MKQYIMLIKPHSNSSSYIYWSKTKGFIYDVNSVINDGIINSAEVFDEEYIEWFKNSAYYDEKNTTIIPVKFSVRSV